MRRGGYLRDLRSFALRSARPLSWSSIRSKTISCYASKSRTKRFTGESITSQCQDLCRSMTSWQTFQLIHTYTSKYMYKSMHTPRTCSSTPIACVHTRAHTNLLTRICSLVHVYAHSFMNQRGLRGSLDYSCETQCSSGVVTTSTQAEDVQDNCSTSSSYRTQL